MQEEKSETDEYELQRLFRVFCRSSYHATRVRDNTRIHNEKAFCAVYVADETVNKELGNESLIAGGCHVAFSNAIHKLIHSKTLGEHPLFLSVCNKLKHSYFAFLSSSCVKNAKDGKLSELELQIKQRLAIFARQDDPGAYVLIWKQGNEVFSLGEDTVSSPRLVRWRKFEDNALSSPERIEIVDWNKSGFFGEMRDDHQRYPPILTKS